MRLADVSIERPVFATVMVGVLAVFGIAAYPTIGVDLFPDVEFPFVTVTAVYPGADPEAVESKVVDKLEEAINTVNGIEVLAIFAVIAGSNASGRPELIPVGIALVVGLHFFPLARLYDQWQYRWTAGLMTAVAVVGAVLVVAGLSDESVLVAVGLACAAVLWASAYHLAVRG